MVENHDHKLGIGCCEMVHHLAGIKEERCHILDRARMMECDVRQMIRLILIISQLSRKSAEIGLSTIQFPSVSFLDTTTLPSSGSLVSIGVGKRGNRRVL